MHLLQNSSGILFEDQHVQIGVKSEYHQHLGRFGLFIGNKTTSHFEDVSLVLASPKGSSSEAVSLTVIQPIGSNIPAQSQLCQMYNIQCHDAITSLPHITYSYRTGGGARVVDLDLPIDNVKFMSPVTMSSEEFFNRWRQIGGAPREAQTAFQSSKKTEEIKDILLKINLSVMEDIDPNPSNFVGASIFNSSSKIGCLMRIEVNEQVRTHCSFSLFVPFTYLPS
jgi:AP-2 complex subunit alpha